MLRRYSRGFLGLQVRFASLVADRLGLPLGDCLERYTTFPLSLGLGEAGVAKEFGARLQREDPVGVAWDLCVRRHPDEWEEIGEKFQGHRLFGCFYYEVREGGFVRPHMVKNLVPGERLLGRDAEGRRRAELTALFDDVRDNATEALTVRGNSWLYNVEAYRRLFPPTFTQETEETAENEFGYLALWGQFYDVDWEPRPGPAAALLAAAERVRSADDVIGCFPLKVLRPTCGVEDFFDFYGVR